MPTVLAAVMPEPGRPIETRELPEPALEPDSGLLDVHLSEVCGTDVHLRDGRLAGVPYPIIPGHVSAGVLSKIRGTLLDVHGRPLREGDRITFLDVHGTCNACWHCLVAKASTRCPHRKVYGITFGLADGLAGGWAQSLYLKPGTRCIRLDDLPFETYMAAGCSLPTALHAIDRAGVRLGDTVLVLGSGPVGLSAVVFAKMAGALNVLCIGNPAARLDAARQAGADAALDFMSCDDAARVEWVRSHTQGRGADITIEATGAPAAVVQAMRFTRDAGVVVVVGQYTDHGEIPFNPHLDLNRKHLDIRGCWGSDFSHFYRGIEILKDPQRARPWAEMKMQRFGLTQTNEALAAVESRQVVKALIDPKMG